MRPLFPLLLPICVTNLLASELATVFTLAIVAVVVLVVVFGGTRYVRRDERHPAPVDDDRLKRLEQAVDAIALEVERIAEGQRFTTKLLSERRAEESPARTAAKEPARQEPPSNKPND